MRPSDALHAQASRFVGTWQEFTVTDEGERLEGTLESVFEVDGCAFVQRFTSVDGGFAFISFACVDPDTERWHETYVFNDGRSARYEWEEERGGVLITRLGGNPTDRRRLRVRHLTPDLYEVVEERSLDDGVSWSIVELTRTRRVTEVAGGPPLSE